jgi:hypothetical protein
MAVRFPSVANPRSRIRRYKWAIAQTPSPVPSDEDDEEMTYDQRRLIRRLRKAGRANTGQESGRTDIKG